MDKFFLLSKTIQGIILMALPTASALLGFDWSADDAANVETAFSGLGVIAERAVEIVGFVWAWYGRATAKTAIKVVPGAS